MTQTSYPPSLDPASRGDLAGIIRFILTKWLEKTDDMLPATVVSYDRTTNRATVQPLISLVSTSNTIIQRGVIASVPVLQLGAGGFVISAPMNVGDLGWIKANDRDISLFLQYLKNAQPNTSRLHSFENGMFIPDTMFRNVNISESDANNLVIQTLDGTTKVSIGVGTITILAPTSMSITSPTLTLNGNLVVTGTIHSNGNITGNGIGLNTHVHTGVQTGGGSTGGPTG